MCSVSAGCADVSLGTTCCIAAVKALQHLEDNLAAITDVFSAFRISPSDYRLCAGFDEGLIQNGLGLLEQIHVLIRSEPQQIESLLQQLESTFSPFSAIIFTQNSVHRIPSTTAKFNAIARANTSDFINKRRPDRQIYPTAVSLSQSTDKTGPIFGSGGSNDQQNSDNNQSTKKGKERAGGHGNGPPDSNQDNANREPDSLDGHTSERAARAKISFTVTSDLYPVPRLPSPVLKADAPAIKAEAPVTEAEESLSCPYQSLITKGTFVITAWLHYFFH